MSLQNKPGVKLREGKEVHKSVWTTANKKKVIEMFAGGATVVEVCKFLGIHKATFYRWLKDERKGDFKRTIDLGIQASEAFWVQVGRDNLENKSFNTSLYAFMMVNKFNYRSTYSKQEVEKTETKTTTVEVKKAVDVDSILEKLQASTEEKPELLN
jgi:transposase-like protein